MKIGIFDSGVGGLSVLPHLRDALPEAQFLYVADTGHAPYGERDEAFVLARSRRIAQQLRDQGAEMLLIACNTATAAAAPALREEHGDWPIVGIEPGIKPAALHTASGHVGVMATAATLRSERYRRLVQAHGQEMQLHEQACTGLALAIEQGHPRAPAVRDLVQQHCAPLRDAGCDVVVLGCTHYPFARDLIQAAMGPSVHLIDTASAVARRAASLAGPLHRALKEASAGAQALAEGSESPGSHGVNRARGLSATRPSEHSIKDRYWTSGSSQALENFVGQWMSQTIKAEPLAALGPP